MRAKSIKGASTGEISTALNDALADGFQPTLAMVFVSVKQDIPAITALFDEKGIAVFGSTTNGEFIDEDLMEGSAAILLLDIKKEHFFIQFAELDCVTDRSVAARLASSAVQQFAHPAFLIGVSGMQVDSEELLAGFMDTAGEKVSVFGAIAGDDLTFSVQYVFTNSKMSRQGIVALALDEEKIMLRGRATSGWKPMGTEKTITRSDGTRVYTINGEPALDLCLKFGGLAEDMPNLPMEMATNFPLQLQRENGAPIMRPAYIINHDDRSLVISGKMKEGSKIKFSMPPDFDVIETVVEECKKIKEEEMPEADAVVMFNCAGRHMTFGLLISKEVEGVKNVWNVPMVGFFSSAELARATDGNLEVHNLTSCSVALKEK